MCLWTTMHIFIFISASSTKVRPEKKLKPIFQQIDDRSRHATWPFKKQNLDKTIHLFP